MLPLSRPALSAVVILNGVWMWNDFFLGFILITKPDAMTLPVGIMAFRGTYYRPSGASSSPASPSRSSRSSWRTCCYRGSSLQV